MGLSDIETIPETGAVFTIGRSRFADNVASHFFIRKDPVISITCGDEHSAVICQSGRLFVFGSNDWGQLGLGHKNHVSKPSCVKILKPEKVTHVACGRAHTLICTGAQKIFACGSDQEGQLGRGSSALGDSASSPVLVYDCGLAGPKILQIAAGSHHSLALTSDGGVIAWGSNLEGQLGLSGISGLVNKPTKVHIPEPVKNISTGYYHSAFLTESGLIYVCGESESGKLGIDVNFSTQVAPKQIQLPSPALHVACGGHHTLILTDNGNLYCTGSNASGQLGMGTNITEIQSPKLLSSSSLENETIARIACGESHSAILTESGKLFTCGDGRHGKLGIEENENNVHELTFAPKYQDLFVSNVACGGCHTILVAHRRETSNQTQRDTDAMQTDHIQKRSSLPPLKLPVNRLQNETQGETTDEKEKADLDHLKNNLEPAVTSTVTSVITEEKERMEDVKSAVADSQKSTTDVANTMNNTEKVESPKKKTEDVKEIKPVAEETESIKATAAEEKKNDNENSKMNLDSENNIQEEKNTTRENEEKNATEKSNEHNQDNDNENNNKNKDASNKENNQENGAETNKENEVGRITKKGELNNAEEKMTPEKQTSPSTITPPPKPPRLKPGSGHSSSTERISSAEKETTPNTENAARNEKNNIEESKATGNADESMNEHNSSSIKSPLGSGDSRSRKSKMEGKEVEVNKPQEEVDGKENLDKQENMNNDTVADDADVIQSPAPRTGGRMSKIFKTKKQEIENGTKTSSTAAHKAKSKTCTIL